MHPAGPIKGAIALCNALVDYRCVTLVSLKPGPGADAWLHPGIRVECLAVQGDWRRRVSAYRALLAEAGGRGGAASISFCFSADMMNLLCRRSAVICSSVRGNLFQNYRLHYKLPGIPFALTHYTLLRRFDHVVAMTRSMAQQVRFFTGRQPEMIGNFVDEGPLDPYRNRLEPKGPLRFAFLGSLTQRKQPLLLLAAFHKLTRIVKDLHLDMIGGGPLESKLKAEICRLHLERNVSLHGHLAEPYSLIARADVVVLPSLSEGLARAALEALHLGVPCIMRDADGNAELIEYGKNGALFRRDEELADLMLEIARWSRSRFAGRVSLLPDGYRQYWAATRYLALVERHG